MYLAQKSTALFLLHEPKHNHGASTTQPRALVAPKVASPFSLYLRRHLGYARDISSTLQATLEFANHCELCHHHPSKDLPGEHPSGPYLSSRRIPLIRPSSHFDD